MEFFKSLFSLELKPRVVHEKPITQTIRIAIIIVLAIFIAIISFFYGKTTDKSGVSKTIIDNLNIELNLAKEQAMEYDKQTAMLESKTNVQVQTIESLRLTIKQMQTEYDNLSNDVNMYKSILDNSKKPRAIEIANLSIARYKEEELENTEDNNKYLVNLTLIQKATRRLKITGSAYIEVVVKDENQILSTVSYSDLTGSANNKYLNFRFFQNLQYIIALDKKYSPEKIKVFVNSRQLPKSVAIEYEWDEFVDIDLGAINCEKPI